MTIRVFIIEECITRKIGVYFSTLSKNERMKNKEKILIFRNVMSVSTEFLRRNRYFENFPF